MHESSKEKVHTSFLTPPAFPAFVSCIIWTPQNGKSTSDCSLSPRTNLSSRVLSSALVDRHRPTTRWRHPPFRHRLWLNGGSGLLNRNCSIVDDWIVKPESTSFLHARPHILPREPGPAFLYNTVSNDSIVKPEPISTHVHTYFIPPSRPFDDSILYIIHYTPTQRGHCHHGMFRQSGTYDEMSGSLGRWLSMTTAVGV